MTSKVTNADLYSVLMDIKEDIGGLKTSATLQIEGLKSHSDRIGALEGASQRTKGAVKVWGFLATMAATAAGVLVDLVRH